MTKETPSRICRARTTKGKRPCRNKPMAGGFVCRKHGGGAPQVKRKAAQRIRDMLAEAIDPNRVMLETACIAYSDLREIFDDDGNLRSPREWPDHIAAAVASVEVIKKNVTTGDGKVDDVIKVRLWPKDRAVEMLMKHHGKLKEQLEHTGGIEIKWQD